MRKILPLFTLLLLFNLAAGAQKTAKRYHLYGVAFYNLENLFDTLHDAGKNDYEYLPDGTNRWGKMKYEAKIKNMATVLSQLCTDKLPKGPAVVGVSEVENARCLEALLQQPALKGRGWKYVHEEGPDRRGVDCAFFYNPQLFHYESHMLVPFYYLDPQQPDVDLGFYTDGNNKVHPYTDFLKGDTTHLTRGFLVLSGRLDGEKTHFIVCHWPSRAATSPARERGGYQVRRLKEALQAQDPGSHVIIMGDMNDDPKDKSMTKELGCKHDVADVKGDGDLYNPWWNMLYKMGQGTLLYDGKWNLFDQIVVSGTLLGKDRSTLKLYKNQIFLRDWMLQTEGRYKGNPLRTHAGGTWLNGYSDHLPTYIYLIKEAK